LLCPDTEAGIIDDVHQDLDVGWGEAPAEIARGGGVGNSLGAQGVEIDLVVAPKFKVFDPLAAGEDVEGDVQDMVRFVIRQMSFEKVEVPIDTVDQADRSSQHENGADAAGTEAFDATSIFIVDIGGGHHRFGSLVLADICEPEANSPSSLLKLSLLASQTLFSDSSTHSKAPLF
jgi:hypothetical protein